MVEGDQPPEVRGPSGTVTFLFSDVVESTRLWQDHPREMAVALARHDEIMRSTIGDGGGYVFSTAGDAFASAFGSADDAVATAVQVQKQLSAERWEVAEIAVRMGLNTGDAHERDGDYFGPVLNRAARIMSLADGGQVLLSLATEELVRDRLGTGISLADVGVHRLRSLSRPEQLFQVLGAGLSDKRVVVADSERGNLPMATTSFVGRADDLCAIGAEIGQNRMVTLVGIGGAGKTRLAIEAARLRSAEFSDGVWWCDLTPLTDSDRVASLVGSVTGSQIQQGLTMTESVVDGLRRRDALLILDNCEHVLDGAARLVDAILRQCARVAVVATSREPLAVAGEWVWPVGPLDAESEGVGLLIERAVARDASLDPSAWNDDDLVEICRQLDGVPLAIEMAAARLRSMSPADIVDRLQDRFRLLRSDHRVGADRHKTLLGMLDWSYQLLDRSEQILLDRLSVFSGSFDLAAVEAVCTDTTVDQLDVLDLVAALVDKSLLMRNHGETAVRYRLLETIRQYGQTHLDEQGETEAIRDRHVRYFASLAQHMDARHKDGESYWTYRPVFDENWDNFLSALSRTITKNDAEACGRLLVGCGWYGLTIRRDNGFADLANEVIEAKLTVPSAYGIAAASAQPEEQVRLCEAGLELLNSADEDDRYLLFSQLAAGRAALGLSGAFEAIKQTYESSRHRSPGEQSWWGAMMAVALARFRPDIAAEHAARAHALVGDGSEPFSAYTLGWLGSYEAANDNLDEAARLWTRAESVALDAGYLAPYSYALCSLAALAASRNTDDAAERLTRALRPDRDGRRFWHDIWHVLPAAGSWLAGKGDEEAAMTIWCYLDANGLSNRGFSLVARPVLADVPRRWRQRGASMAATEITDYAIKKIADTAKPDR